MNPLPTSPPVFPGHPLPSAPTAPANQASQFFFQPTNEQVIWLQQQQQQQMLREQQASIMQLFYAQQARGFSSEAGIHGGNMNMFSNPLPTAPMPYAYSLTPFFNGPIMTSFSPLNTLSYQYPMTPALHQPPPLFPPSSLPATGLTSNDDSSTTGHQPSLFNFASNSNTPGADGQISFSVSPPISSSTTGEFTAIDDLILAKALHEHGTSKKAVSSLAGTRDHSGSAWQIYYASKRDIIDKIIHDLYPSDTVNTTREESSRRHTLPLGIPIKEPTPSKLLVPQCGGNKYTEEDDSYFTQYVLWSFSQDIEASKSTVCQALCLKSPHHSLASWKTYWWSRERDIERVRQLFKAGTPPSGMVSFIVTHTGSQCGRSTRLVSPLTQGTKSWHLGSQSNKSDALTTISDFESDSSMSDPNDANEDDQIRDNPTRRVSTSRNPIPYTKADLQAIVKSMAEFPTLPSSARWNALSKNRPAHSSKAWGEYYRRNRATIDRNVRRLVKRRAKEDTGSNHVTNMLKDTLVNEILPKTKPGTSHFTVSSRLDKPVKQNQLPSTSQDRLQLDTSLQQLQPPSPANPEVPHMPTKPATISESSCESQSATSDPIAAPRGQAQSASAVSEMVKCQPHGCQPPRDSFQLSHVKPSQQPVDRQTVRQESSTTLSAAQWPSETQGSEIDNGNHPVMSRLLPPSRHTIPDMSSPAASSPPQPQTTSNGRIMDSRMSLERVLLAAAKRRAPEEVTERGGQTRRKR